MKPEEWLNYCAKQTTPQLFAGLRRLDGTESRSLAAILAHLAELYNRRAAEEIAFPSLYAYCTKELGYSEAEALLRIRTARAAYNFPCILTMIAQRQIHVTAVSKLWPHLTSANYRSLLAKAGRRTLEELDRLLAELAPLPEKRSIIRTLSTGCDTPVIMNNNNEHNLLFTTQETQPCDTNTTGNQLKAESSSEATGRVLFHFVAGETLRRKYNRAKEILRHKYPEGRPEQIFDYALETVLDRKDRHRRIFRQMERAG